MKRISVYFIGCLISMVGIGVITSIVHAEERVRYHGIAQDECVVNNGTWNPSPSNYSLTTLPRAIIHMSLPTTHRLSACRKKIILRINKGGLSEINMLDPININISGTEGTGSDQNGDGIKDDSRYFEIVGEGGSDGKQPVVLNLSGLTIPTGRPPCAIVISGAFVRLKNIQLKFDPAGNAAGISGVCINEDKAVMDGVVIQSPTGDGFLFGGEGVIDSQILGNSTVNSATGYAINFGTQATNTLSPNRVIPIFPNTGLEATDANGLILPPTNAKTLHFTGGDVSKFFNYQTTARICLASAQVNDETNADGEIEKITTIYGYVVDSASNEAEELKKANLNAAMSRLQIYTQQGFYAYVGLEGDSGFGYVTPTRATDLQSGGSFEFKVPTSLGAIALVPEGTLGKLGTTSDVIDLTTTNTDGPCAGRSPTDLGGGQTPTGPDGSTVGRLPGMNSVAECLHRRAIRLGQSGQRVEGSDSDGDGLLDDEEDANLDCRCDRGEYLGADGKPYRETCWYEVDTDHDGIPDGHGIEQGCSGIITVPTDSRARTKLRQGGRYPRSCIKRDGGIDVTPPNAGERITDHDRNDPDGDGIANILDNDSDDDGFQDGEEDRNYYFMRSVGSQSTVGYFYQYQGRFSAFPFTIGNAVATCTLGYGERVGVRYDWYRISGTEAPVLIDFAQTLNENTNTEGTYQLLACRNRSLLGPGNYDGIRGIDELNPLSPDTDDDDLCDGNTTRFDTTVLTIRKSNCEHPENDADRCPLFPASTNDGCDKAPQCSREYMWNTVLPHFLNVENGTPIGFVDKVTLDWSTGEISNGTNGVPDVLEVQTSPYVQGQDGAMTLVDAATLKRATRESVQQNCPTDFDGDTIPDCVENPKAECKTEAMQIPSQTIPNSQYLKYYLANSDGDNRSDIEDVCPTRFGVNDRFTGPEARYSCEAQRIYDDINVNKMLACFLDRDHDSLYDCQEDVHVDGLPYRPNSERLVTEENLLTIDTDPLNKDSDDDGLEDAVEKNINNYVKIADGKKYTNPAKTDTDEDGLSDGQENRDGSAGFKLTPLDPAVNWGDFGCTNPEKFDTDPTLVDTDGDGLSDYAELLGAANNTLQFQGLLEDPNALRGGIQAISNPRLKDSDGDGLNDNVEYTGGRVTFGDSHPCIKDSDGDGRWDNQESRVCRLNKTSDCANRVPLTPADGQPRGGSGSIGTPGGQGGINSDLDALDDDCEVRLGTNPSLPDTDLDGLDDGEEDVNHDCTIQFGQATDPNQPDRRESYPSTASAPTGVNPADSDGDSIRDGLEVDSLGTDPTDADTDDDCIPDGPMTITGPNGESIESLGEDKDRNGRVSRGSETNPAEVDTDGDGLADGNIAGLGEDLDCNGVRNRRDGGQFIETSPILPDSDLDGDADYSEAVCNGIVTADCAIRASEGASGCSLTPNAGSSKNAGVMFLGALMVMNALVMKRKKVAAK